ncbi:hypothetical protein [Nocardia alni]|uniref:hypothetical protein n=1 Tax=Nocardia alni TaxID=2815723 RepID=UPI001C21451A|nr:hypothetical protein [Nocardia alni]
MVDLILTAGRREQLAALLDDAQRLKAEYPSVAEYLDAAPILPGTGDDRADAAFDLRFVHYLTSDESANPYWDIVAPSVSAVQGRRRVDGGRSRGSARLGFAQTILQTTFAYAVPAPDTIAWIADRCAGHRVVEIGAGRGYWAAQLARAGVRIEAYDSQPPDATTNLSFPSAAGRRDVWHPVDDHTAYTTSADDVLFLCWPPGWEDPMASTALAEFEGDRLIYIGEPKGGKTADDAFFDALSADWTLESEDPRSVAWWNLADTAQAWVRR